MRLWHQLALAMVLVALGPVLATGYIASDIADRSAMERSRDEVAADARVVASGIERWVGEQAGALGGQIDLYAASGEMSGPQMEAFLRAAYRTVHPAITLVVRDGHGEAVLDGEGTLIEPLYLSTARPKGDPLANRLPGSAARAERFLSTLRVPEPGRVHVGQPAAAAGEAPSLPLWARASGTGNVMFGAEVDLGEVQRIMGLIEGREVVLLLRDGQTPLGSKVDLGAIQPLIGSAASFELSELGLHGAIEPVPGSDWFVVVTEPLAVVRTASRDLRWPMLVAMLVSAIGAVLVGVYVARHISLPVTRLHEAADRVAVGELGLQVAVARGDEIGDMAEAFNTMSSRLMSNRDEIDAQRHAIEAFNLELQDRVDERTRELQAAQKNLVRAGQLAAVAEVGAGLAHELNNPLAGILGMTQLLKAKAQGTDEAPLLARVEEMTVRCRDVVDAMLRISSGDMDPVESSVVDLGGILREAGELVVGAFRQRGVGLDIVPPSEPLLARIDPVQGTRIITQVLNSMRAGLADGAALHVEARKIEDEVHILFTPDRALAAGGARDDWMAAGLSLWVARQSLDRLGGRLEEPDGPLGTWVLVCPGA